MGKLKPHKCDEMALSIQDTHELEFIAPLNLTYLTAIKTNSVSYWRHYLEHIPYKITCLYSTYLNRLPYGNLYMY